jgi:hypothetical protein
MAAEKIEQTQGETIGGILFDLVGELLTSLIVAPILAGTVVLVISLIWPDLTGTAFGMGLSFVAGTLILGSGGKILSALLRIVGLLLRALVH